MIREFRDQYRFLSNFWPCTVYLGMDAYPSVEHAYQAAKTESLADRAKIRKAKTAGEAKKLGRTVKIRADWESVKIQVMRDLLVTKFEVDPLRTYLIETHPHGLEEGNTWGDKFWGVDLRTGQGQNHLGKLLMKIREQLKNEISKGN
jgi:ribA/ribD-fused uncharacterized protein